MTRILAVDWGTRRVGLAAADAEARIPRPLPTLRVAGARDAAARIARAAREEGAGIIVLGLPLRLSGASGDAAGRVRRLGKSLEGKGFIVRYQDERLTSEEALAYLRERGERRPPRERVDQIAALLLLTSYLEAEETPDA